MATDTFSDKIKTASDNVDAVKNQIKDASAATMDDLSERAGGARAAASSMAGDMKDSLVEGAERQKNAGADAVSAFAQSARAAAGNIEDNSPHVARIIRTSADAVERVGNSVRDQNLGDLADAVTRFAARQPVAVFGIGLIAGLVFARLVTTSDR